MKLTKIHTKFNTDKGVAHNYIPWYEETFSDHRTENLKILEIGVLFGDSLKMWEMYFENSLIYGIEDFSQKDGHEFHDYKPVDKKIIMKDINSHERITLLNFDCEDITEIKYNLSDNLFDIIIDDASHKLDQQIKNLENYSSYLNENGIYIIEDVQTRENANLLIRTCEKLYPNKKCSSIEFNIHSRTDDRIVVLY